jgi:hypothetical protein
MNELQALGGKALLFGVFRETKILVVQELSWFWAVGFEEKKYPVWGLESKTLPVDLTSLLYHSYELNGFDYFLCTYFGLLADFLSFPFLGPSI